MLPCQWACAVVRPYGDPVGLGGCLTPHVLRDSCATHKQEHGIDPTPWAG